jgi:hypothetical protein
MRIEHPWRVSLAVVLLAGWPQDASGQHWKFTRILENSMTLRPDGQPFGLGYGPVTPSFDGKWVVFRDPGPWNNLGSHAVIWSYNTVDGELRRVADLETRIGDGDTRLQDLQPLDTAPVVRNETVVFVARDSSSGQHRQGIYSVPASGGAVQRIADYDTWGPGGERFTLFDVYGKQLGAFSFDGVTVAFTAIESAFGAFSAAPDGSSLGLIADSRHSYSAGSNVVTAFYSPVIAGGKVVMIGRAAGDSPTTYNGIYLGSAGGNGELTELVNSSQTLPDNPNPNFHTRYETPVLAFDGTLAVFRAIDAKSKFSGLYYTDLESHNIRTIADINSRLPGLGQLSVIAYGGAAISGGAVLFKAADIEGNTALYRWRDGTIARVIGMGDQLDGQTVMDVADPVPAAAHESGVVLNVDFGRGMRALYLATELLTNVSEGSL